MIEKLRLKGFSKEQKELENQAYSLIRQKPNRKFLGLFKPYLGFYNLVNTKKGRYKDTLRSEVGEPPAILDSTLTELSNDAIRIYLQKKGYFNVSTTYRIDSIAPQKVAVTYEVTPNEPYRITDYKTDIGDTAINRLVSARTEGINTGVLYDEYQLGEERENITRMLKNNGYATFENAYVRYEADTTLSGNRVALTLIIEDPAPDRKHEVYRYYNTYITVNASDEKNKVADPDTVNFKDEYFYTDFEGKYRARIFDDIFFFNRYSIYEEEKRALTYTRFGDLGLFRFININTEPHPGDSTLLDTYISLSPAKRQSLSLEGEMTVIGDNLGGTGGFTYNNKNFFNGGELFELRVRGGEEFNLRQLEASTRLSIPKILSPFNFNLGRFGVPRTTFSLNFTDQREVGNYQVRSYNTSLAYEWKETREKLHELRLVQIGIIRSAFTDAFEQQLIEQGNAQRLAELRPFFILGSRYTYTNGLSRLRQGGDFLFLKGDLEVSGNTLYLVNNLFGGPQNRDGDYMIGGLIYPQYVRPDIDVRLYRQTGKFDQLVFRLNAGGAYSYGNTTVLPYQRRFFAGGANSIRAWRVRSLGPGTYNFYDSEASNTVAPRSLENFLRVGDMKLEANFEYRFRMADNFFFSKLNGALFMDAGNIWNLRSSERNVFSFGDFYRELAVGAGFGFRFDIDFLVLRIDLATKIHDPQFTGADRWVIRKWGDQDFKDRYDYNFWNLTLGIGYPF